MRAVDLELKMFDRRMLTDVGLALLIALPSALPAAPDPWTSDNEVRKLESPGIVAPDDSRRWAHAVATAPVDQFRYGRS